MMTSISTKTVLTVAVLAGFSTCAFAQGAAPTPWELKPDMGYAYGKDGKTLSYKMGTNNAGTLLKGAKKVPKGTLVLHRREWTALHADRPLSRGRRQVQVRVELRGDQPQAGRHHPPCAQVRTGRMIQYAAPSATLLR